MWSSVTDSDSSTWSLAGSYQSAQIWYAVNRPANPSLTVSLYMSGTPLTTSVRFFDVQGTAIAPFDVSASAGDTNCSSVTSVNNQPTITPTTSNGLVIATMAIGQGPGLGVTSPSGAFWDLTTYTGARPDGERGHYRSLLQLKHADGELGLDHHVDRQQQLLVRGCGVQARITRCGSA